MRFAIIGLAFAISCLGCSKGRNNPAAVPVSGTVTLNGKPLADVEVTFASENFSSFGKTDEQGRYALVQGAVPGKNLVSLSKWEGEQVQLSPDEGIDEGQLWSEMDAVGGDASKLNLPRQLIPEAYRSLEYVVPDGGTESADFRLTGK